ncbi:MAG: phosphoglucosamine mutase [Clostridia bacterium]|nr:phosphoglucosamine mutase [Clostridia bacterium]
MGNLFGTDGVRGVANRELTAQLAYELGRAGAHILCKGNNRPHIVVGKDTRISGDMLESALIAGICSMGVDVIRLGIIPTPGVAFLTRFMDADAGIMISASHNPIEDNGIKFFDSSGYKLEEAQERAVERIVREGIPHDFTLPVGGEVGKISMGDRAAEHYVDHILGVMDYDLSGLRVVVDCACGAAYEMAPRILRGLGAEVISINDEPDGSKINVNCGSTNVEELCQRVVDHGAHMGIAYDGDADRLIAVDEKGGVVDGDAIMLISALHMSQNKSLKNNMVVATVMSNLGLELALKKAGIKMFRTPVGDKYVLRKMLEEDASLGGEQSGHIILSDYGTTGDGIVVSCLLLKILKDSGEPLSLLAGQMKRLPQVMINVRVEDKKRAEECGDLAKALEEAGKELGSSGRILVRPSGTEPLIRVMVEGQNDESCREIAERLASVVEQY